MRSRANPEAAAASSLRAVLRGGLLIGGVLVAIVACDTDDGRQLDEPTAEQRANMPTTTATSSTLASIPGEFGDFGEIGTVPGAPVSTAPAGTAVPFALTMPWPDGGPIDPRFTCDGEGRSPSVQWTAPPAGTVELVLLVTDDNAEGFIHHAVAAIPPTAGEVGESGQITGAFEGLN
ncbi:MAG: hypothetical protein H0W46_09260, partial [Acidimicrobiia bacterium]|nr:hypothetical protein [Acidimicrobiia bacterium]